ncbi:k+-dependent Na+/Ca+ exchanger related-protein [Firmicutes bacterium CAG:194]|nr:k+-dependent Na+/Ca+ exchanger related-protein [Firmicutes bacterium CAG:194]HCI17092.1 sodium:calcium antiporter [Lachnospiraceae bacterium]HCX42026.1 sodium:calcium antiporter [Lachnospiraceae bacterium]
MNIFIAIALLIVGFVMLTKGADWFVDGSSALAFRLGIPQLVIGLTIVAMGTSAPEAAVSITSALKGNEGITVGNVVGSNIMNILLILGIASVIVPLAVQKSTRMIEIPYMIAITVLFGVLGYTGEMVTRVEGGILWIAFLIYLGYLLWMAKKGKEDNEPDEKQKSLPVQLLMILAGLICIVLGSDFVVDGATEIAKVIGISDRIIGLTIVAFGTSLPELVTSIAAARRGNADIAIGNIVGSNVFNILFVAGTSALISPVVFESKFVLDTAVATATAVLLLVCVCNKEGKLKRSGGIIMLAAYAAYFVKLLIG